MTARLYFLLSLLTLSSPVFAQTYKVTGHIVDAGDTSTLIDVSVVLAGAADSTVRSATVSNINGDFEIDNVAAGAYKLKLDYVGYKIIIKPVTVSNADVMLGTIKMSSSTKELKSVTVAAKQTRAEQMGDTSQYNADAFKTHPDATAEDLVTKMPGVTSDNTGVKVNGETVQQVYVDGKPFFGSDPTLALKNLPSEVIDKIQVFDKLSDQSSFTGFDDGTAQKTMNIITKGSKREGVFGKVYAGYGTDDTYLAGGSMNFFNGDRRITLIGLSNNINQQNFSSQDILGVSGGSGQNRGGSGGGRGAFGGGGSNGGGASNFLVGPQNGITTTNSLGFNYSDNWGKKIKVSGSYFFNGTDNNNTTATDRDYYNNQVYHENDTSEVRNYNHRFNLRFEYTIDSFNSIIFTSGVSFQQNFSSTGQYAETDTANSRLSSTRNFNSANNSGYSSSDNLLIQHKFKKQRRTISLNVNTSINEKSGTGTYYTNNLYTSPRVYDTVLDQHNSTYTNGYTVSPNVTYTEPMGKRGQLMANYNPSYSKNIADKETNDRNDATGEYNDFNSLLSNKYNSTYITEKGGLSYRVGDKKLTYSFGANLQYATLNGEQTFPYAQSKERNFESVLPNAMLNYRYADGRNLRIMYRTNTVSPSITQLQDVIDNSSPLLLKTGNPDLKQDYEHTLIVRYGLTKSKTAHNFFINFYANYINNYIANATYQGPYPYLQRAGDTLRIPRGTQLTLPVNLNGYFNERFFVTYGLPLEFIKSNLNLNGGLNYTRTPGQIGDTVNYANNIIPSAGVVVSSNISQNVDFTLSYYGSYNIVNNTVQKQANNNYYNHTAAFKINYIFLKRFVLNTNITDNYYTGFSGTGSQNYFLWNAYFAYKFLKNQGLEARFTAFDILNQNKSITRNVTETYIENDITKVLKQYFMFQLTYTIRNFKGSLPADMDPNKKQEGSFMRGPGGTFPGGGGGFRPGGGPGDDH